MGTDAVMALVVRLWTATNHTAEQDANKDKQLALYYQNLKSGHWTLDVVGKAFDNLSRDRDFWPSWAKVEEQLNLVRTDMAPTAITSAPQGTIRTRMADRAMLTPIGQQALREGWGRSYHVSIARDRQSPDLSERDIDRFRKGRGEFLELFGSLDLAVPGTDMSMKIGQTWIDGEAQLQERFLRA